MRIEKNPPPRRTLDDLKTDTAGTTGKIDKPRRGRPRKPVPEPEPVHVDPKLIKSSMKLGFKAGFIITKFDGWKLTDTEADELVECWQPIYDKYIGPRYADYFLWMNAIMALGSIVWDKVEKQREWEQEQAKAKKEATQ